MLRFMHSVVLIAALLVLRASAQTRVEQWDVFEIALPGPAAGNPFVDVTLTAEFTSGDRAIKTRGFYDGEGIYRIRFMPVAQGTWTYQTQSNVAELNEKTGELLCEPPSPGNHGPVRVRNTYHFAYADGAPYKPVGTTCYNWVHQVDSIAAQTLATLKDSSFNKIRMCVFPTAKEEDNPIFLPFELRADQSSDTTRFNPKFFRNLEQRVKALRDLNVQADLILFHPYNRGGFDFDRMDADSDDRYLRYLISRLAAYRNVWWSMANEYDLMRSKQMADWDRFFQIVQQEDPYDHLRSVHFSRQMYDPSKPWVSHMSVQNGMAVADFGRASLYRDVIPKPVVYDEVCYEGDLPSRWGRLSGEQMTAAFWFGTLGGTYVGHGEAFEAVGTMNWLSRGSLLRGQSHQRIAFLKKEALDPAPETGIEPIDRFFRDRIAGKPGEYYLLYFGPDKPREWTFELPRNNITNGLAFEVAVLDTWNMTVTRDPRIFVTRRHTNYIFRAEGEPTIKLPGNPWMALRVQRVRHAAE